MSLRWAFNASLVDLWGFIVWGTVAGVLPALTAVLFAIGVQVLSVVLLHSNGTNPNIVLVGQTLGCLGILSAGKLFGKSLYDSRFKYVNPTVAAGLNLILGVLLTNGAWLGAGICSLLLGIAAALVFGFVGMPGVWCLIWPATYGAMFAVYYVLARWWDAEAPSRIRVVRGQQVLDGQKHAQELANRKRWKV